MSGRDVGVGEDQTGRADQRARSACGRFGRRAHQQPDGRRFRVPQHRGGRAAGRRSRTQGEEPERRQPGHRRDRHARQRAPAHPAAQYPPAVVARYLGAGQRRSYAEFLAGGRIAEAQHHGLGNTQRPVQLLAVQERPPPGLVDVGGPALIRGDQAVALPGHQRVHRHQLERWVTAHPDLRSHREYALLTAEPGDQDRYLARAGLARRCHLSFCGHTATTPPLPSIRPGSLPRRRNKRAASQQLGLRGTIWSAMAGRGHRAGRPRQAFGIA